MFRNRFYLENKNEIVVLFRWIFCHVLCLSKELKRHNLKGNSIVYCIFNLQQKRPFLGNLLRNEVKVMMCCFVLISFESYTLYGIFFRVKRVGGVGLGLGGGRLDLLFFLDTKGWKRRDIYQTLLIVIVEQLCFIGSATLLKITSGNVFECISIKDYT